jgi:DNA topoisomerase-1
MDIDRALRLLSLPREVGRHPEDNEPILAGIGRYGPYVQHGRTYANLADGDEVFDVGLNRAVTLIDEKRSGVGRGGRAAPKALNDLGAHPQTGEPIRVLSGRYGPYVNSGKVNANVPKGTEPEAVTLEQAVALLAERAAKGGKGKKAPAKKKAAAKKAKS